MQRCDVHGDIQTKQKATAMLKHTTDFQAQQESPVSLQKAHNNIIITDYYPDTWELKKKTNPSDITSVTTVIKAMDHLLSHDI